MQNKVTLLMSKDINDALNRARNDERLKCNAEKEKALEDQRQRLEGEWSLKVKEKEAEIESLLLRMRDMSTRDKEARADIQDVREVKVMQRRIASDLVYIAKQRHEDDARILQEFLKLQGEVETSERKILAIEQKKS
jgi:hypothetical protein